MKIFSNFSLNFFCLLCGFFFGNLFGSGELQYFSTYTPNTSDLEIFSQKEGAGGFPLFPHQVLSFLPGPGIIGFVLLFFAELLNWSFARAATRQIENSSKTQRSIWRKGPNPWRAMKKTSSLGGILKILEKPEKAFVPFSFLNSLKTGFFFGIFVDAFKVGS
jgi:hypothetical protein